MNPESPEFMVFFGITWVVTVLYVGSFLLTMHRRQIVVEGLQRPLLDALRDGERPILDLSGLMFLFSGGQREIGDAELSRRITITRVLFTITGVLMLILFYSLLAGGAANAR
jgi:hypothetical protein